MTPTSHPAPLDLTGPLPTGTVALEASAGTGKTWHIAGLTTRYVAEGHARLDELLVVTFGRAATSELRTRVRERLISTHEALRSPEATAASTDPVVRLLGAGSPTEVDQRRDRIGTALATFDSATVATVHQFCQQVLHGLGIAADHDRDTALVENLDDLITEVCDDLYLRFYTRPDSPPPAFPRSAALKLAQAAVNDPTALLQPEDAPADSAADLRCRFAGAVRAEVERRKRAQRILGFDDLLIRARDALADPLTGDTAAARLRDRYRIVLVDEFQDTDPTQWEVLTRAFHGHRTLIVIGDPKQAIYAFRGADVHTYLTAARSASTRATLGTNWRSDPQLLTGLHDLFRGAALGHPDIVVHPVLAGQDEAALGPEPDPTPVRLRLLSRTGQPLTQRGDIQTPAARTAIAADVAAQVVHTLNANHTTRCRITGELRPLRAGDIAVLVRKGAQALTVRQALLDAGVPCVLTGTSSVFATPAAAHWITLLEALEQPHRAGRVRRLALTPFIGQSAAAVDAGGDDATDQLAQRLRAWGQVLAERSVSGLFATLAEEEQLPARLLRQSDGERQFTDLRHLAETLHGEEQKTRRGLVGLLAWLREQVEASGTDADQERARRLDTDDAAVQILTVHTSKGLEFPITLVPYAWDNASAGKGEQLPRGHSSAGDRTLHVGGQGAPGYQTACRAAETEDAGEELRLLYVAATRAVSRLVLWWAPTYNTNKSPLHRLLFADDPAVTIPAALAVPTDVAACTALQTRTRGTALSVGTIPPTPATPPHATRPPEPTSQLDVATFLRHIDTAWRRTSYSALTRSSHDQPTVGSEPEPEATTKDDEPDTFSTAAHSTPATHPLQQIPSPMAGLPAGASFGTLVHAILEHTDPTTADLSAELRSVARQQVARHGGSAKPDDLADALIPVLSTPLGPLADRLRLRDIAPHDRLPELEFELPLAGGDSPRADVRLGTIAALLRRHLAASDPVAAYADYLDAPTLASQQLRGYLNGSLDAVVRISGPRYLVLDYKTNRLAGRDAPLTAWHYRREALDTAVLDAHYPLQALIYSVALHRYLRWRQPGYDPDRHLGGVLYLFTRGMCGELATDSSQVAETPGVWSWHPPAALITDLSDLFAGAVQ